MSMKKLSFFSVIVALTFMFSACNKNAPDQNDDGGVDLKKAVETGFDGKLYTYGNITPPTYNSYGSDRFNNGEAWDLTFDLGKGHGQKYEIQPPALGKNQGLVRVWRLGNGNGPCFITFYKGISDYKCYNLAVRYAGGNNGNSGNGANGSGSTNLAWEFHTRGYDQLIMDGTFGDYLVSQHLNTTEDAAGNIWLPTSEGNIILSKKGEYITFRLDYPLMVNVDNPWFAEDGEGPSTDGEVKYGEDGVQLPKNVWNSEVMNPGDTHIAQINWGGPNANCGKLAKRKVIFTYPDPDTCDPIVVEDGVDNFFEVECDEVFEFPKFLEAGKNMGWLKADGTYDMDILKDIFNIVDCKLITDGNGNPIWVECGSKDPFDFDSKVPCEDVPLFLKPLVNCTNCEPVIVWLHPGDYTGREITPETWDGCVCFGEWLNENFTADYADALWPNRNCKFAKFAGWGYTIEDHGTMIGDEDCIPIIKTEGDKKSILIWALWDEDCCPEYTVVFTSEFNDPVDYTFDCTEVFDGCFGQWVNTRDFQWKANNALCPTGRIKGWKFLNGVEVNNQDFCDVKNLIVDGKIEIEAIWECLSCTNPTLTNPIDVIFLLDYSASMNVTTDNVDKLAEMKKAALQSIGDIFDIAIETQIQHRVAVVVYGNDCRWRITNTNGSKWANNATTDPLSNNLDIWMTSYDKNIFDNNTTYRYYPFTANQNTNIMSGMNTARQILAGRETKNASVIILMTDGQPTFYYESFNDPLRTGGIVGTSTPTPGLLYSSQSGVSNVQAVYYTIKNIEAVKNAFNDLEIYTIGFELDKVGSNATGINNVPAIQGTQAAQIAFAHATIDPIQRRLDADVIKGFDFTVGNRTTNLYGHLTSIWNNNPIKMCYLPYDKDALYQSFAEISSNIFGGCSYVCRNCPTQTP